MIVSTTAKSAILAAARFAPRNPVLPVYECLRLRATADGLVVTAGDLERMIHLRVDNADVVEEGCIYVPAHLFAEFVKTLHVSSPLRLHANGKGVLEVVTSGVKGRFRLLDHDDEFPGEETGPTLFRVKAQPAFLHMALQYTIFAVSRETHSPALNSVCFDFSQDGDITVVGLDGYRLSCARVLASIESIDAKRTALPTALLPLREARALLSLLEPRQHGDDVIVEVHGDDEGRARLLSFDIPGDIRFVVRLVDVPYPRYDQILSRGDSPSTMALIRPQDLRVLVRRAHLFTRGGSDIVTLVLNPKGVIHVLSEGENGGYQESMDAEIEGEGLTIHFNGRYLEEALGAFSSKPLVRLNFAGAKSPVVIRPKQGEFPVHLLMPMNPKQQQFNRALTQSGFVVRRGIFDAARDCRVKGSVERLWTWEGEGKEARIVSDLPTPEEEEVVS